MSNQSWRAVKLTPDESVALNPYKVLFMSRPGRYKLYAWCRDAKEAARQERTALASYGSAYIVDRRTNLDVLIRDDGSTYDAA